MKAWREMSAGCGKRVSLKSRNLKKEKQRWLALSILLSERAQLKFSNVAGTVYAVTNGVNS